MSRAAHLLTLGLLALLSAHQVSCGWFGLSKEEIVSKLNAEGRKLPSQRVFEILSRAKDPETKIDNFSVKELRAIHDLRLDDCSAEQLDERHEIANRPLQDGAASQNLRHYATDNFETFAVFCARNIDKLIRRQIVAIGSRTRQDLSYFKSGVFAAERRQPDKLKAIEEYLTKGGEYVNEAYKETVTTGCKSVTEHLSDVEAIQRYAQQVKTHLNLNYSFSEWLQLNEYCKLYLDNFAKK